MSSWNFLSVLLISYLLGYVAECNVSGSGAGPESGSGSGSGSMSGSGSGSMSGSGSGSGSQVGSAFESGSGDIPEDLASIYYSTTVPSPSSIVPSPSSTVMSSNTQMAVSLSMTQSSYYLSMSPSPSPSPSPSQSHSSSTSAMSSPTPSPNITRKTPTLEEAKKAAVLIVMQMSLSEWTPSQETTFKQSIADAINQYCAENECSGKTKRSTVLTKRSSQTVYTAEDIVILPGYPREITVDGRTELEIQFYVASMTITGNSSADVLLTPEVLISAVTAAREQISQEMGVPILSMIAVQDDPTQSSLISTEMLLTVIPPAVAGGFVLVAILVAVLCLLGLWLYKRKKNMVLPVTTVQVDKARLP